MHTFTAPVLQRRFWKALSAALIILLATGLLLALPASAQTSVAEAELVEESQGGAVPTASPESQRQEASGVRVPSVEEVPALGRTISVRLTEAPLEEALTRIAAKGDVNVSYLQETVAGGEAVTLSLEAISTREALAAALQGTGLQLKRAGGDQLVLVSRPAPRAAQPSPAAAQDLDAAVKGLSLQAASATSAGNPAQQQGTIAGTVTDAGSGNPLPGVNVVVEGTQQGAATSADGTYEITGVEAGTHAVTASFVGYADTTRQGVEVQANQTTTVDFALEQEAAALEEMVVVGYGEQREVSLTNSVSQVPVEDIDRRPVADIRQSLQGFAPGVTVQNEGGRPGNKNIDIRIRGITTLGNNSPLVLVNGIEQSISDINPNDIENISVLKDASSTAIYGSRAASGVVLITTKRGREGDMRASYEGSYAVQDAINRPQHMDLEPYFRLENVAHKNAGSPAPYSEEYIREYVKNAPSPEYPLPFPWWRRDELGILQPSPQQDHSLSVSGGNEKVQVRTSLQYQHIDGIAPNFSDRTKGVRLNADYTPLDELTLKGGINYRNSMSKQPGDGELKVFNWMLHATKFSWPKYENGKYGLGPQANNPLLFSEQTGEHRRENDHLTVNLEGEVEILPYLSFSTQYSLRYSNTQTKRFRARYFNRDPITDRFTQRTTNSLYEYRGKSTEYTLNSLLNYNREFGSHNVEGILGYSTIDNDQNFISGYRQGFYNNQLRVLEQGSEQNKNTTGSESEYGLRSLFGRVNYNYGSKYYLEINARYDGSSRFSKGNRYSFFPSFSVGWRLSEEPFWKNLKPYVNEFKLRGSYGATGNQAVGLYTYYQTLSTVDYSFGENPVNGYAQTNLANQNLTWETTTQTNLGIDLEAMDSQLAFSFDYYNKVTKDILLNLPIPRLVGLSAPPQNAGTVKNAGYEISLDYRGGDEFSYSVGINFSDNKNEVVDLANTGPYIRGSSPNPTLITKEGLPNNSHWGYVAADDFFQTQEEADNWPTMAMNDNPKPGDVKYKDLNGDGIVNPQDRTYLGRSFPRFNYGLDTNFGYKNFELFTQWQGAAGYKTMLGGAWNHQATYEAFTHENYTDYWTPDNRDAKYPRPIKADTRNRQTSNRTVIDSDYLKLKNVTLSYSVPSDFVEFLRRAEVYVGATEVLTFSEMTKWDIDPEVPSGRANFYPQVRTYTLGLRLAY